MWRQQQGKDGISLRAVLDGMDVRRFCCRGMFVGMSLEAHLEELQAAREKEARRLRLATDTAAREQQDKDAEDAAAAAAAGSGEDEDMPPSVST